MVSSLNQEQVTKIAARYTAPFFRRDGLRAHDEGSSTGRSPDWLAADDPANQRRPASLHRALLDMHREVHGLGPVTLTDALAEAARNGTLKAFVERLVEATVQAGVDSRVNTYAGFVRLSEAKKLRETTVALEIVDARPTRHAPGAEASEISAVSREDVRRALRYSCKSRIDEQDFIDGNLESHQRTWFELGRELAGMIADLTYSFVQSNPTAPDGQPLFSLARGNLATNGSALSDDSLRAGEAAMLSQRDERGRALDIAPSFLIVPPKRFGEAKSLVRNTDVVRRRPDGRGSLEPLAEPRLAAEGCVDPATDQLRTGSDTQWLLAATATDAPVVELVFLEGRNMRPRVTTWAEDGGFFGFGFAIDLDVGARCIGSRGMYLATGQA